MVTADLRGLSASSVRAGRSTDFSYLEIVEADFPVAVGRVREELPGAEVFLGGHSLGGQLACLYSAAEPAGLAGLALVATCSVYHRGWPLPWSLVLLGFQQLARLLALLFGHFPGQTFRFGGARGSPSDGRLGAPGAHGRYQVAGSRRDYEALLAALELPVVAFSFTDDTFCTEAATDNLLAKMPAASTAHHHLAPAELGTARIGHFSWVKQADLLAPRIVEWLVPPPSAGRAR